MRLLVTLADLAPGAPLDAAVAVADALDARRVPLTLLVGPRPHPEVAAWAAARRRVGDAVLLHGTRVSDGPGRPYRRLPAHEAGLRLAGALRSAEALGLPVDGFAAPGWACSEGTRRALALAGTTLLVDDAGVHRLGPGGTPVTSGRGPVVTSGGTGSRGTPWRARTARRAAPGLRHLTAGTTTATGPAALLDLVDAALAAGAVPGSAVALAAALAPAPARRRGDAPDPEHWSITA